MKHFYFLIIFFILVSSCSNNRTKGSGGKITGSNSIDSVQKEKPIINVYIENSGSMDGYVKGVTEFEQAVYSYLSDIKIAGLTDSLNLYYINSQVIPQGSDIADFIDKLEPSSFKAKGGNRGSSDLANVIETVLKETKIGQVAILVTDGIFSPGKGKDAQEYLIGQQIGIKRIFADYLSYNKNASVLVYQMHSNFKGIYYNNVDSKTLTNQIRPYYIWIIGDLKQLANIKDIITYDKLKMFSADKNSNIFSAMNGIQKVKYSINPSIGKFKKAKENSNCTIKKLEKDSRTGKVSFAVNVDFSNFLIDESYILDSRNYENSSEYEIEIKQASKKNCGYTHVIHFSANRVYAGTVVIKLKASIPNWIEDSNDDIGKNAIPFKTYGIKYQLNGVYDAFTFSNKYYTEIKININK